MPFLGVVLLILILDQGSKYWVITHLAPYESWPVWPPLFYLTHVNNPGAAFGLGAHNTQFFIVTTLMVMLVILAAYRYWALHSPRMAWGLAFVFGGALGNLLDRLRWGYVIDFLDFRFWPVFNVADVAIVGGALWLLLLLTLEKKERELN
ncbi:MAG TPA: signal peptidase II [Moorella mulderi]|nr:signal peptidase II [Moorella mulderi]